MNINPDVVPSDLESAVQLIVDGLEDGDRDFVVANDSVAAHHTLGQAIRNGWSLWDHTKPLATWFRRNLGLGHADDMSGVILERAWCRIRGTEHDLEAQVHRFKLHWERMGLDPLRP